MNNFEFNVSKSWENIFAERDKIFTKDVIYIIENNKNEVLITFEYIFIEYDEDHNTMFIYDIFPNNDDVFLKNNNFYTFTGFTKNNKNIIFKFNFEIVQDKKVFLNSKYITLDFNFLNEETDYQLYNQTLVEIYYHWNEKNNSFINIQKKLFNYTLATMLFSGVPDSLPNNKEIILDGSMIDTNYELFNIFSELFLGNKSYIANNLDSLLDTIRNSNLTNNNKIFIKNYKDLEIKINSCSNIKNYLNEILYIFKTYNFKIEII